MGEYFDSAFWIPQKVYPKKANLAFLCPIGHAILGCVINDTELIFSPNDFRSFSYKPNGKVFNYISSRIDIRVFLFRPMLGFFKDFPIKDAWATVWFVRFLCDAKQFSVTANWAFKEKITSDDYDSGENWLGHVWESGKYVATLGTNDDGDQKSMGSFWDIYVPSWRTDPRFRWVPKEKGIYFQRAGGTISFPECSKGDYLAFPLGFAWDRREYHHKRPSEHACENLVRIISQDLLTISPNQVFQEPTRNRNVSSLNYLKGS